MHDPNREATAVIKIAEEETTDDLREQDPILGSKTLHEWARTALLAGRPFFDPYGHRLVEADGVLECLRRFGVVYASKRRRWRSHAR
jgi:hypothetical protein